MVVLAGTFLGTAPITAQGLDMDISAPSLTQYQYAPNMSAYAETNSKETRNNQLLQDLRRFEIIAFGSFPFSMFFTSLSYDIGRYGYYGFSYGFSSDIASSYEPVLFGERILEDDEKVWLLVSAAGVSVLLASIDLFIEVRQRNHGRR